MTAADLLPQLSAVRPRGARGWLAQCPAHHDHSPSLSVREGDRGVLPECWAGCSAEDITRQLGLIISDLFFDSGDRDREHVYTRSSSGHRQSRPARHREGERAAGGCAPRGGFLVRTAQGLSIAAWTDDGLATALDPVGRAWNYWKRRAGNMRDTAFLQQAERFTKAAAQLVHNHFLDRMEPLA